MEIERILTASLSDLRKNLRFILPHAVEYLLDALAFLVIAVVLLLAIGLSLPSLAIEELLYTQLPFFAVAFIIFGLLVFVLLLIFFNSAARAAIIGMSGESFQGRAAALSKGLESAKKHGLEIFLFQILLGTVYAALVLAALLPVGFLAAGNFFMVAAGLLIFLICFSLFFLLYALTLFVPQEVVLREKGLVSGFRESFLFVREHFKAVIAYGAAASVAIIFVAALLVVAGFLGGEGILAKILQNLLGLTIGLIVPPYFEIVKTYMVASELAIASTEGRRSTHELAIASGGKSSG